ncbi:MAG: ABC transporter substrate-binding protein, partial [Sphaerochaeta sp.]|nr:ABC transporter substrate-binding protein [Sphaerochaeta sp.]
MKKRGVLVLLVLLTAISIVGAAGTKETAAAVQSGAIGSAGNPVKVTYLCKDVDPITDAQQLGMLEKAIEEGMAKEGKYVDLVILSAPTGSYATVVPIAFRTGQINPDLIYFQGNDQPLAQEG